jgi:hypothetical protein
MGHCTLDRKRKKKKQKKLSKAMEEALAVHTQEEEEEEEEENNETLNPQTLKTQSLRNREAFFAQKGVLFRFLHENRLISENVQTPGTGDFYFILILF